MATLDAINKHNMVFVSAQPDEPYFHWQVEIYLYQFAKHGISDRCYALFGYRDKPSVDASELATKYKNVLFYKDTRDRSMKNFYTPSIRPHILKQFFAERPELGKNVFYHDSDIFLVKFPPFEKMLGDDVGYVSDTINYIGYDYIHECTERYRGKHPHLENDDLFKIMCATVGVPEDLIKSNQANSGGAQYLLKNIDAAYWQDVETACYALYDRVQKYIAQYPVDHHIQVWTTDMWVVLWLYWKRGGRTLVHNGLDFCFGTWSSADYYKKPIFHLAGVTDALKEGRFYKGGCMNTNPMREYARNKSYFDHVKPGGATYEYVAVMKEYVQSNAYTETTRFMMELDQGWSDIYVLDTTKQICDRPVWRSANGSYMIFHNKSSWTVTNVMYEAELKEGSGGFAATFASEPYDGEWNIPCTITKLPA